MTKQTPSHPEHDHVRIFDTTLRDGEQSPGATLTSAEKLEVARQLASLGVDVMEAGLPGVLSRRPPCGAPHRGRSGHGRRSDHLRPRARQPRRRREVLAGRRAGGQAAHPHLHRLLRPAHGAQARDDAGPGGGAGARHGRARARPLLRRRVLARGRQPRRHLFPGRGAERRDRGGRHHAQHPGHRRLRHARGVRSALSPAHRRDQRRRSRDLVGALPRRPGHGHRQLDRRPGRGRAAGGGHHQRHRRARRQHQPRGGGDGAAHPASGLRAEHRRSTPCSSRAPRRWSATTPGSWCRRTRRSWAPTRSPTRPASTRTACSRTTAPTRS